MFRKMRIALCAAAILGLLGSGMAFAKGTPSWESPLIQAHIWRMAITNLDSRRIQRKPVYSFVGC